MSVKLQTRNMKKIRLGTRGSPLALVQAHIVRDELAKIDPSIGVEVRIINTSGDWRPEQGEVRLEESQGGKGLFAKELEAALLAREIDIAVHSMKDMEVDLPAGLEIPFMLSREDVRDVFLSNIAQNFEALPMGSVVGTVSVRRASFLLSRRPDLRIVPLRGNVQTRIDKLAAGQVDATMLACAGLKRLNLIGHATSFISVDEMLPAVGQGAIGIEIRTADRGLLSIISQFSCLKTLYCVSMERSVLRALGGSCHTPVGVYAAYEGDQIRLRVRLFSPDGRESVAAERFVRMESLEQLEAIGLEVGSALKARAPQGALGD